MPGTKTLIDAEKLRGLLEKQHGGTAMIWRDQFALGCWFIQTGRKRAGQKLVDVVIETVREIGSETYLNALTVEASRNPIEVAISAWPHVEVVELFKELA